ncbi:MAG: LamB/YcsF family protein [Bryobacteraceae bacterium]|nr:LamB/YcsF family protein [Bryobacteraceae bacterium]
MRIDLNADLGESVALLEDGRQEALLRLITSANIACGGHAGDAALIQATVAQCQRFGVAIGAHPGYPDRENFGRVAMSMPPGELARSVAAQVRALPEVRHVKPHGALYNTAARDAGVAREIVDGLASLMAKPVLYGLRGSVMLDVFAAAGYRTASEVFADRRYQPDGSLLPRHLPGALIEDPAIAAANALSLAAQGADTICIHSDTPGAVAIAGAVRQALLSAGYALSPV